MGWNGSGDLVMVFGVGGETKILVPKNCEESKGLVMVEAMEFDEVLLCGMSLLLYLI